MYMKRDMELIRAILQQLEAKENIEESICPQIEGYSQEQVSYHIQLLSQAGYVQAEDLSIISRCYWEATTLTNDGHDFLETARNDKIWCKTKEKIISIGGGITLKAMYSLMEKYLQELI